MEGFQDTKLRLRLKKNKVYPAGRRCTICQAVLSIYNSKTICMHHGIFEKAAPSGLDILKRSGLTEANELTGTEIFDLQYNGRVVA